MRFALKALILFTVTAEHGLQRSGFRATVLVFMSLISELVSSTWACNVVFVEGAAIWKSTGILF